MSVNSIAQRELPGLSDDENSWYDDLWGEIKGKGGEILEQGKKAAVERGKTEITNLIEGKKQEKHRLPEDRTPNNPVVLPGTEMQSQTGNALVGNQPTNQGKRDNGVTIPAESIISKVKNASPLVVGGGLAGVTYLISKSVIGSAIAGAAGYLISKR